MTDNNPANHPERHTNAPFECFDLTRMYPFAGGNAIEYVFRHNGVEDLEKALWYVDHASDADLRPAATWSDMKDFGFRCTLAMANRTAAGIPLGIPVFEAGGIVGGTKAIPAATHDACVMLRTLQHANWQGMHGFWKGMWELARGYASGRTRARRAIKQRIKLLYAREGAVPPGGGQGPQMDSREAREGLLSGLSQAGQGGRTRQCFSRNQ